ncbi:V-ATPase V0 sector subunit c'' [Pycnococcus provasolii]|uniref:inorganic diphosphatase n=1 Tax=Pycnococcus provasolii TaxID=41880 RepID=A0A830H5X8_9CHLO|nr:V-ATPase V0 sector subunit c'' [Pycnococcus provasolii]|mmetsp:Transcript_4117/g.9195  ORF Transcript_4117/g.9195 Transcript_4117/m.9195 type:complete len:278 (-) Transcript_4117:85-918(-)|eukprot:CAMPEP_0119188604 /NCGR_PEP_ID=MMETSP1316-20130426/139_1 /TAXON_ID=41880 /ORGANISM="Pycnococcus provasolii, Strain RCC2336" /LENGTH=277 /DNA_ID=CAMNT_0007183077 /DNA_START=34 /DNA_END=867 /DNA_ORIENTATION=+
MISSRSSLVLRRSSALARASRPRASRSSGRVTRAASTAVQTQYSTETKGESDTLEWRMFVKEGDKTVSPWHDIPASPADGLINFFCEIPKETAAKMEVTLDEAGNPIKQDVKKEKLRFYPYNINWNYGMMPQTWEDPKHANPELNNMMGDNDPLDIVEIGSATCEMGATYAVKPLGVYAMIDDGEVDWKLIAIRTDDPKADAVNDVADVEKEFPGELEKIRVWFRDYKMPDGKPANEFGYDDKCMDKAFALGVIDEVKGFYNALKSGERENDDGLAL